MESLSAEYLDADSPMRKARVPMLLAFWVSVCAHIVTWVLWPEPVETIRTTRSTLELELTLVSPVSAVEPPADETLRSEPVIEETPPNESPATPPETVSRTQRIAESVPMLDEPEPSPAPLKLVSPKNWDEVLATSAQPSTALSDLAFRPGLRAEAGNAQRATARRELVAMRQQTIAGLSEVEFGSLQGFNSETLKIDGRCYTLRPSVSVSNDAQWWSEICRDSRQHPMTLELPEYDRNGRIVAD